MSKQRWLSDEQREQLAREIIAEIAAGWKNVASAYVLKEGDAYTFTFVLHRHGGPSVVSYNPFEEVKKIVFTSDLHIRESYEDAVRRELVYPSAMRVARHMLDIARQHFYDSLEQLKEMAETRVSLIFGQAFGGPEYLKQIIDNTAELFDGKLRDRLSEVLVDDLKGPHFKFTDGAAQMAIHKLGGRPSRRALARELGVTPATILNWAKRRGFKNLNELLDHLAEMQAEAERLAAEMKRKRKGGNN